MQKVIEKAGGTMDDIVQIMTFHVDTGKPFWEEAQVLWEVTKEMLQNGRPCGTGVMVKQLAMPELLIEIQAVAVLKEK
jgi:enamine deaminase RidA (YjgF/YER057c/UK114 family)